MTRFTIGEITVDVVVDDDDFQLPLREFLPGLDLTSLARHRGLLEPEFLDTARDVVRFAVQAFVIRADGRTLLVDTCVGEQKDRPEIPVWNQRRGTGFLERLARAGVDPAGVDTVFCTHLLIGHVGWNTRREDGRWMPTFPNARHLVGRAELADWSARCDAGTAPAMHVRGLQDSVFPLVDAGLVDLVDDGHEVAAGLVLAPLPGHTAGQMGLRVDRQRGRAVFCGDAIHSPAQVFQPAVSTSSCADPRLAAATRCALLEEAAATGRLVVPAHFRGQRHARVRSGPVGFEPVFDQEFG
ncbi:MAG TPA: MBL fold metallo-hydrolase [Geminicoccaceae bacterium]|nr:MBL fold metallo-hydrolase [Geminicoccaceae bacterium]